MATTRPLRPDDDIFTMRIAPGDPPPVARPLRPDPPPVARPPVARVAHVDPPPHVPHHGLDALRRAIEEAPSLIAAHPGRPRRP